VWIVGFVLCGCAKPDSAGAERKEVGVSVIELGRVHGRSVALGTDHSGTAVVWTEESLLDASGIRSGIEYSRTVMSGSPPHDAVVLSSTSLDIIDVAVGRDVSFLLLGRERSEDGLATVCSIAIMEHSSENVGPERWVLSGTYSRLNLTPLGLVVQGTGESVLLSPETGKQLELGVELMSAGAMKVQAFSDSRLIGPVYGDCSEPRLVTVDVSRLSDNKVLPISIDCYPGLGLYAAGNSIVLTSTRERSTLRASTYDDSGQVTATASTGVSPWGTFTVKDGVLIDSTLVLVVNQSSPSRTIRIVQFETTSGIVQDLLTIPGEARAIAIGRDRDLIMQTSRGIVTRIEF